MRKDCMEAVPPQKQKYDTNLLMKITKKNKDMNARINLGVGFHPDPNWECGLRDKRFKV